MEDLDEYYDFENIIQRMLDKIPNSIDKREGSIIYDAIAPCAAELAQIYIVLKDNIDLVFADTAVDEYLDRLCSQIGIERRESTTCIKQANFYDENDNLIDIDIGQRFTCGNLYWLATEKIEKGKYKMQCEATGKEGNSISGTMIPVDYIQGLAKAELQDLLIPRRRYRNR